MIGDWGCQDKDDRHPYEHQDSMRGYQDAWASSHMTCERYGCGYYSGKHQQQSHYLEKVRERLALDHAINLTKPMCSPIITEARRITSEEKN